MTDIELNMKHFRLSWEYLCDNPHVMETSDFFDM